MPAYEKVDGKWRGVWSVHVKVDGVWRDTDMERQFLRPGESNLKWQ